MAGPRVYSADNNEFLGLKNDKCLSFHTGGGYGAVVMNSSMILGRPFVPGRMVRLAWLTMLDDACRPGTIDSSVGKMGQPLPGS